MSAKLVLDNRKLLKALNGWRKLTAEEQARELRKSGRALAVRLANATQPYGLNAKARKKGENAVLKDIASITKPLSKHWMNEAIRMKQFDPASFKRRFTNKEGKVWLEEEDVELNSSSIKRFHKSMRNKGDGRTRRAGEGDRNIGRHTAANRGFILQVQQQKYINETKRKVGIAKAGWAECAAQLGGFDGVKGVGKIQDWITKLISKYGSGSVELNNKYVRLTNSIPWIGRALGRSALRKSLDIQRNTLAKSVIEIVKHNSKKAGFA
jgi:hypothetical protein